MEDDNKPFACSALGCGMRFINEDHLMVHRKKHEMSLNLCTGSEPCSAKTSATLFLDQTPTPTRFIRNCEEVGLFQDLQNVNPFDETFRKAAEAVKSNSCGQNEFLTVTSSSTIDPLNTPSLLPSLLDGEVDSTTVAECPVHDAVTVPDPEEPQSIPECAQDPSPLTTTPPSLPQTRPQPPRVSIIQAERGEDSNVEPENKVTAISSPVIVKNPHAIRNHERNVVKDVAVATPATTNVTPAGAAATSVPNGPIPVWQLLVKMPDGRAIPVNMPAIPLISNAQPSVICQNTSLAAASSVPVPVPILPNQANSIGESAPVTNTATKMKLKQILTHGNSSGITVQHMNGNSASVVCAQMREANINFEKYSSGDEDGRLISFRRSNEDDPEEKRRRFLERNRAAATRCRQKRKQKIMGLEKKANELSNTNLQLQNEVSLLRSEVAQLKTMLLAHRDCPVTLEQHGLRNGSSAADGGRLQVHVIDMSSAEAIASTALTSLAGNAGATFLQAVLAQTNAVRVMHEDQTGHMTSEMASANDSTDSDSFSNDTK